MIQAFKDAYKRQDGLIHLNNAGVAPWPTQTEQTVHQVAANLARGGAHAVGAMVEKSEEARSLLGAFLGAQPNQIAFFQTCAVAISQVAFGLQLPRGSEIVVFDQEYPSNFYPWRLAAERAQGELKIAKSTAQLATPIEAIEAVVTEKTKVIAVSWVQYRNGAILDLEKLAAFAKARGILTCVDIIQGAGLLPFDFNSSGLDFACGGAHKWLTSPLSLGYLMMKPEHVDRLEPLAAGAMSFGGFDALSDLKTPRSSGVARYEPGGRSILELVGLGETLKLMSTTGVQMISSEIERLANNLARGLKTRGFQIHSPHGEKIRGSIVNASHSTLSMEEITKRLNDAKISYAVRPPGLRLSAHAFNTDADIARTIEALS